MTERDDFATGADGGVWWARGWNRRERERERREREAASAAMRRQMIGAGLAQVALISGAGALMAGLRWWLS